MSHEVTVFVLDGTVTRVLCHLCQDGDLWHLQVFLRGVRAAIFDVSHVFLCTQDMPTGCGTGWQESPSGKRLYEGQRTGCHMYVGRVPLPDGSVSRFEVL